MAFNVFSMEDSASLTSFIGTDGSGFAMPPSAKSRSRCAMCRLRHPLPLAPAQIGQIVEFALSNKLPGSTFWEGYVEQGFLMFYGARLSEQYRRAVGYVDKVLKGAEPASLPVEQPTEFDLVINLKTAKMLGLTIPPTVLAQADAVIE